MKFTQVKALIRKELRISARNKKSTACEIFLPIILGCFVGWWVFMMLDQFTASSMYKSDLVPDSNLYPGWFGLLLPLTTTMESFAGFVNNSGAVAVPYMTLSEALTGYNSVPPQPKWHGPCSYILNQTASTFSMVVQSDVPVNNYYPFTTFYYLFDRYVTNNATNGVQNLRGTYLWSQNNAFLLFSAVGVSMVIIAFLPNTITTSGRMVDEKINRSKELLKVMGLDDTSYFSSHLLGSQIRALPGNILMPLSLCFFGAVSWENYVPFLFMCMLFTLSCTNFAFLMPALFSKQVWVNVVVVFFVLVSSQVANFVTMLPEQAQKVMCLHSTIAFYYGGVHLFYAGQSFQKSPVTLEFVYGMLLIDSVLYFLLAVYISKVFPGEFGVPESPLYFLNPRLYYCGCSVEKTPNNTGGALNNLLGRREVQNYGTGMPLLSETDISSNIFIHLKGLSKKYANTDVYAVNNLNLKVERGTIYALLGHNGAGKTTTMNMLIGLTSPTSYTQGSINGFDLNTEMSKIRNSIGICPQFDVLFSDLTAREHFELFAELRGLQARDAVNRVTQLLTALELPDDNFTTATMFSGGMKRRLSAGNALVGNNALVILDEPSSGLDPLSRRKLWQIIKGEKDLGKTVLLSTHYMEEADYLGDTIGIMSKGHMYCSGTAHELKERFGCGFYLKLVKSETTPCNVEGAQALVHRLIPEAKLESQSSGDLTFVLPQAQVQHFETLLKDLEVHMPKLGIHSYGVNMTTLEDVFVEISMKEGAIPEAESIRERGHVKVDLRAGGPLVSESFEEDVQAAQRVGYISRMISQVWTLLIRRFYIFLRNRALCGFYLVVPMCLILLALFVVPQPGSDYNNDDWYNKVRAADLTRLELVYYDRYNTAETRRLVSIMTDIYPKLFGAGSRLETISIDSKQAFDQGRYVLTTNLAYSSTPPSIYGFEIDQVSGTAMNITYMMTQQGNAAEHLALAALLRFAMAKLHDPNSAPNFAFSFDFFPPRAVTPAPSSTPSPPTTVPSWVQDQLYDCTTLIMMSLLSITLSTSFSSVFAADELKNQIYSNLRVCGMLPASYWTAAFLHDFFWCSLPLIVIVVGTYRAPIQQLQGDALGPLVLAFLLFSCHMSLQSNLLAIWKPTLKATTYMLIMLLYMLLTTALPFLSYLVAVYVNGGHEIEIKGYWVGCMPGCAFFMTFNTLGNIKPKTYDNNVVWSLDKDASHQVGIYLFMLGIELIVPLFFLWMFCTDRTIPLSFRELGRSSDPLVRPMLPYRATDAAEDPDVTREWERVQGSDDRVRALDVVKIYENTKVAVNGVTLGVKKGECFGLLGPNGAGKTTLIKQLLGVLDPDQGTISHGGITWSRNDAKDTVYCASRLGVCQQHDALWDFLTGRQHMELYLRIRLTTLFHTRHLAHVTRALESVQLLDDGEKLVRGYSGGMKRKLSVALAMFTGAESVFLDEPSTGMDPFARRALWKVIHNALGSQHSVLLTTHSMEEADNVCGRIAIITEGSLKCIGNSQHLKNRFGGGYVLSVVLSDSAPEGSITAVDEYILSHFRGSTLAEGLEGTRKYNLGIIDSLAGVFGHMERSKDELYVKFYSISQTSSLEQIFLRFVGGGLMNQ